MALQLEGGPNVAKDLAISFLLDFYGDMLTEKQRIMIEYYYNDDLSLAEIADNEGITRQGVRDSIKRAEGQLLELEERLGLAKRFQQVQTGLEQILLEAAEIRDYNQQHDGAEKINTCANNIMQLAEQLRD